MLRPETIEMDLDQIYDEYWRCYESPAHFATNYCYTLDIETSEERLFPDYPYIREFLEENKYPHNEHIEKSRQMIVSWAFMALFLHDITFKNNIANFITSRKEALVDDGGSESTPHSLMGRIRFMWERLPEWLKMPLDISYLRIKNPVTQSFIIGESSNPNAGRSGTWYRALMDEAALIPRSDSVFSSIKQACKNGLYMNSTPYGRGNVFARIRFAKNGTFKRRTLHWKKHPERDETWYILQKSDMTDDQVARELDISYEKSVHGQIYHMFDHDKQAGSFPYEPDLPMYRGWDFGVGAPVAILWIQERPVPKQPFPEIRIFDEHEEGGHTPPYFAKLVKDKPYKLMTEQGNWTPKDATDFGDPAGKQREINLKSWVSWLREEGIFIKVKHGQRKLDTMTAGQRIMPYVRVDDRCTRFLECISSYKHPTDDQGNIISDNYEDNEFTHIMKAFEYYAVNRFPLKKAAWKAE